MIEVIMPKVDMDMSEGTIAAWRRREGEAVEAGEPLFDIITDKANVEIEAPATGLLWSVSAAAGQTVPIGQPIAYILAPGEQPPADDGRQPIDGEQLVAHSAGFTPASQAAKVRATPLARKLCRERGLDLHRIQGSGPSGRIERQDVMLFLERNIPDVPTSPSTLPAREAEQPSLPRMGQGEGGGLEAQAFTRVPLSALRRVIAERMTASARNTPHFTLNMQVDMAEAVELRRRVGAALQREGDKPPSFTAILVRALAPLLLRHPYLNATLEHTTVLLHHSAHIGVAVDRHGDLLVPVVRDAQRLTLAETAAALRDLHERAQAHTLGQAELSGSTFTISNLGMYGVDSFTAIINPPESAILAAGRIVETPVAIGGAVVVRPVMQLTLAADHRIVDGATAARFLAELRERLEEPYLLI
jgi:pyruvate dehydrogenase E2 component (dihydrolipoamide acetyltransferase)